MSLLSLLLRPRAFEERLEYTVEVNYLVVGGGSGQVLSGTATFPGGVPLTTIVAIAEYASSVLGAIEATGGDAIPRAQSDGGLWLSGSGFRDNTNSPPNIADGPYFIVPNTSFNGRDVYSNGLADIKWYGSEWLLCAGGYGCLYKMGEGATPGGAQDMFDFENEPLYPPPPAVVQWPFTYVAGDNRGGILLSYADTTPALVANGMTFTTSTSGGRRQYTFTAGSGTIVFPLP